MKTLVPTPTIQANPSVTNVHNTFVLYSTHVCAVYVYKYMYSSLLLSDEG